MATQLKQKMEPIALAYVTFVIALGAFVMLWYLPSFPRDRWFAIAVFAVITIVTEAMPVELPRRSGTVSVSFAVIYASIILFGPAAATWIAALATIRPRELSGHISLEKVLFNRAQLALSAAAAGLSYVALGGVPGHVDVVGGALALVGAALVYSVVNITTVVAVLSLINKTSFWGVWVKDFKWMIPHYLALTPLGILIGVVAVTVGLGGVLLLFVPLLVARYSLQLYGQMRRAYLATIQAMVAAIEARDPCTAGHSRRVATHVVAAARNLRLSEEQIEKLEYSAWLHDVGKLAVPDQILQKKDTLTSGEWEQMRKHPETGANILNQIQLLGRDVDVILHHHERWDGGGYPDYMSGKDIPLGARLIAIADAYEAMTSRRPYRNSRMTSEQAMAEIRRNAGSQFDPSLVEVFATTVASLPDLAADADLVSPFLPVSAESVAEAVGGAGYQEAAAAAEAGTDLRARSNPSSGDDK